MPEPIDEPLVKKARVDSPPRIDVPEVEKPGTSSPKGKGKNQSLLSDAEEREVAATWKSNPVNLNVGARAPVYGSLGSVPEHLVGCEPGPVKAHAGAGVVWGNGAPRLQHQWAVGVAVDIETVGFQPAGIGLG